MMKSKGLISRWVTIFKNTFTIFMNVKGLKFSASLAYYTIFSLAPLLVLTISLAAIFFGQEAAEGKVFEEINGLVGDNAAAQIETMLQNIRVQEDNTLAFVIGIGTLLVGATTVFADMQHSINKIWEIKPKPKRGWVKLIKDRLLSSSLILSLGFLLIVSLIINGLLMVFMDYVMRLFSDLAVYLSIALDAMINFMVISALFGVIFKFLPDVRIKWKDVRAGAFFTALLFMLGRVLIGFYIQTTGQGSTYGAAGSIIILLLWVYYTAAILYIGASFTRAYSESRGRRIAPAEFAVHVEERETEKEM
ncbi:YihY/virulence factor BrkB family protein [Parapedobacter sp. 10938]|uniref:YihY/virulence factor BrkB family protein n=1 Tax=Parapedobacter flavus TaxID=3110225 RepID=UPI002DB5A76C|nr:YihY/virulence factor BrkB family protein [Parapedobacter sp. 10938]MEC3881679.1 YihY/virulence factor BrkB family protein [Parapedobacter sp. 10938]